MKYVCTQRFQYCGIHAKGEILELTDLEYAIPNVKASVKPIENQPEDSKKETEKPNGEKPLVNQNGSPLTANAQITTEELKRRLSQAGVAFKETADKQELFVLLQDVLKPHTGTK